MKEMFAGVWCKRDNDGNVVKREGVSFDRIFRGYRFTDDECLALLQGYYVDIKDIQSHGTTYSVRGKLVESVVRTEKCVHKSVYFKALDTLLIQGDTVSESEYEKSIGKNVVEDYKLDKMMEQMEDEDAQLSAMLDYPEVPEIEKISGEKEKPKYIPVVSFGLSSE